MNNIEDVRNELGKVFQELKAGTLGVKEAEQLNNGAGKIISSLKVELEYYKLSKKTPEMPFFEK